MPWSADFTWCGRGPEDEARRIIAEFAQINPTYIVPMHCTAEVFIAEALRRMPEKVILTVPTGKPRTASANDSPDLTPEQQK